MNRNRTFSILAAGLMIVIVITLLFAPGAWAQSKYKTLYKFTGGKDGNEFFRIFGANNWFSSGLILDSVGNLYGTTPTGGADGYGTAFKLAPNTDGTWTETVLYSFIGKGDGAYPLAGLVLDSAGNLYGTTSAGGMDSCSNAYGNGCGVVFELTSNLDGSWTESVLYGFTGGADGAQPEARLIFDTAGNLYGTTIAGGFHLSANCNPAEFDADKGCGTVFELTLNSDGTWTESVLYAFTGGKDGGTQIGALTLDAAGNLYGTAQAQSTKDSGGVVFKLTPAAGSWKETILYDFPIGKDGGDPFSFTGLVLDSAGNIYGTTYWGVFPHAGTVFKLTPTSSGPWKWSLVRGFGTANAYHPIAGVVFDGAGNLYGATYEGGSAGCGIVFELTPTASGGWKEKTLHSFANRPACDGMPGVVIDPAGNLYGATLGDGRTTFGSVYEITP